MTRAPARRATAGGVVVGPVVDHHDVVDEVRTPARAGQRGPDG